MNKRLLNRISYFFLLLLVWGLVACAPIQVGTIPPPSTARLRIYVQPFTTFHEGKGNWKTPHEQFVKIQVRQIERYLAETGVYEIVEQRDVRAVLGNQKLSYSTMQGNDWELARKIGRALHADYVMVMERGTSAFMNEKEKYFLNMLLNVKTGKKFGGRYSFTMRRFQEGEMPKIIRLSYRDLFRSAKEDLFATAISKAETSTLRGADRPELSGTPAVPEQKTTAAATSTAPIQPDAAVQKSTQVLPAKPAIAGPATSAQTPEPAVTQPARSSAPASHDWLQEVNADKLLIEAEPAPGGEKLVVYDLETVEPYRTAALILSEALREELFLLKRFTLVNRENLQQILKEMSLQQTGLIDEQQAVKMGKGLAANQVVTGRLGVLGKIFVLQTKRIDVETFTTLGLASAKAVQGQEDAIFEQIPSLARHLVGQP